MVREIFTVKINGTSVVGEIVKRSKRSVEVKMLFPEFSKIAESSIPLAVMSKASKKYGRGLFLGHYGNMRAKTLLINLYGEYSQEAVSI